MSVTVLEPNDEDCCEVERSEISEPVWVIESVEVSALVDSSDSVEETVSEVVSVPVSCRVLDFVVVSVPVSSRVLDLVIESVPVC